ncbi:MAG: sulfotransferase domain-containing protein [Geminocystis sp.]|nr:sulfotransferase domain-containing protein [Geminocystis sp.]MDW8462867.1 sulfotransferase domain-containing protein [Geminocystis sp.]
MRKPNFFIIGAPKCGTGSLASWLAGHPNVYMSPVKEPNCFNTDQNARVRFQGEEYEALFRRANSSHLAVGEASVWYLASEVAVPKILEYADCPKFIVMVRNPVEMAYSLHDHMLYYGIEDEKDFGKAWQLQKERARGRNIPRGCFEPKHFQYGWACSLGHHIERLLSFVERKQVHFVFLDDIRKDARSEYLKVLNFLGLEDDGRTEFPAKNTAKEHRLQFIAPILRWGATFKKRIGIYKSLGIVKLNTRYRQRPPMDNQLRAELIQYFREDIRLMERLLNRDLSDWLRT